MRYLFKSFTLLILLIINMLSSCKDYEPKDFYGEWYYNNTRFFFHENGIVEIHNLDTLFAADWDEPSLSRKKHKGTWEIDKTNKWRERIVIEIANFCCSDFFIENEKELTYYIGDPDEYNRAVIRKKKE